MQSIIEHVNKLLADSFETNGLPVQFARAVWSNRPDLGDFQCNAAMQLAKVKREPPAQIAREIADELNRNPAFSSVSVAHPGFINIRLSDAVLLAFSREQLLDPLVGAPKRTGKVIVDFGGPNVAKPLHVGHLRSLVIGESLRRILVEAGFDVLSDVHLGDWGLQMGMLISEVKRRFPDSSYFNEPNPKEDPALDLSIDDLQLMYPHAAAAAKADPARMAEARAITAELQRSHTGYIALWNRLRDISLQSQKSDFDRLGAHFDLFFGESDAQPFIPELIEVFKSENLVRESEGALIIDVTEPGDKFDVPPLILSKSDGASLYSTTDLATILLRVRLFRPDWIVYVVDQRQSLHFEQVFRAASKAGIAKEVTLTHAGFGTVNGEGGKPYKTRDGGVALLSSLIQEAVEKARERVSSEEAAENVGIGAIKFADLDSARTLGYVFDADRLVSLEGRTGPYVQYACVRIKSILDRAEVREARKAPIAISTQVERELLLECSRFSEAFFRAIDQLAPSEITEYIYSLAKAFSRFYAECPILNAESRDERNARLSICDLIHAILSKGLFLLGINVPEKM